MADNKAEYIITTLYDASGAKTAETSILRLSESADDSAKKFAIWNNALDFGKDKLQDLARAAVETVQEMISLGSDSRETASLLNNALGPAAESFNEQIAEIAENTRRSSFELTQGSASIIAMTRSMGFGQETAANFGATVAQVGADFSSYFNVEQTQFFEDFQAALAGSSETMTKYGIDVRETTLQQAALNSGLIDSLDQYDRQVRAQVLLSEVQRQGADAYNDAAETAEGYANSMKGLDALFTDAKEEMGLMIVEGLEPSANLMYELAQDVLPVVIDGFAGMLATVNDAATVMGYLGEKVAPTVEVLLKLEATASKLTDGWLSFESVFSGALNAMSGGQYTILKNSISAMGEYADNIEYAEQATQNAVAPSLAYYQSFGDNVRAVEDTTEALSYNAEAVYDLTDATENIASIIYDEELAFRGAQIAAELHANTLAAEAAAAEEVAKAHERRIDVENEALAASESLFDNLAQAASEGEEAVTAANAEIANSYRTAAFEATVAANGFNESTAQLAVNLGIMTQEEADAKLKFVETSAAISELTSNVDYLNASATDQAEAAQLLALGYTTSSEEALALSQTISGNLSASLIESTELSAAQIALLDAMTGSHKAEVDVSVIGLEALREADALRRNLQTSQQSARAQLAENDYAESIGGAL